MGANVVYQHFSKYLLLHQPICLNIYIYFKMVKFMLKVFIFNKYPPYSYQLMLRLQL